MAFVQALNFLAIAVVEQVDSAVVVAAAAAVVVVVEVNEGVAVAVVDSEVVSTDLGR